MNTSQTQGLTELLRGAADAIKAVTKKASVGLDNEDVFGQVIWKYRRFCDRHYRSIQILGMTKPADLTQIYTEVAIRDDIRRHRALSEKELTREILQADIDNPPDLKLAADVAASEKRLVLLGRPGSGKSTFMKHLLLTQVNQASFVYQFPVLIPVNQITVAGRTIFQEVSNILRLAGLQYPDEFTNHMFKSGRLRILIDGLDEARHSDRLKIIDEIQELSRLYFDCSFVVTCRSAAYDFWLQDFLHFEVVDFSVNAIEQFINRWFIDDPSNAADLLVQIRGNSRLEELCSNPLMLTIVCIGFRAGAGVSTNRSEIYKEAIEALLKNWDITRRVKRDDPYQELTPKRRQDLLCELAARTFSNGELVFSDNRANDIVSKFVNRIPSVADYDCGDILTAIESQHGLVVRRSRTYWSFAHLTFQEYFTAQYIIQKGGNLYQDVVRKNLTRPDWREVLILIACLLPSADDYVLEILGTMTRIGYGKFFVELVDKEISQARLDAEYRRQDSSWLFDNQPEVEESEAAVSLRPPLSVIEGGLSSDMFSINQARTVIERFRSQSALRLSAGLSLGVWPRAPVLLPSERPSERWSNRARSLEVPVGYWIVSKMVQNLHAGNHSKKLRQSIDKNDRELFKAVEDALDKLSKNNLAFPQKVARTLSAGYIFEITNRRFTMLLPDCVEACFNEVQALFEELSFKGIQTVFGDAKLGGKPEVWLNVFKEALLEQLHDALKTVASANSTEVLRLRALSAGEVLADILTSEVFLSKRVRLAAVRTLGNLILNDGQPPPEPPRRDAMRIASG